MTRASLYSFRGSASERKGERLCLKSSSAAVPEWDFCDQWDE